MTVERFDTDIKTLAEQLEFLAKSEIEKSQLEATLQAQISAIRLQIHDLQAEKAKIRRRKEEIRKDQESLIRRRDLALEAEEVEKRLAERHAELEKLLEGAPWYNKDYLEGRIPKEDHFAFDWQIEGALRIPERGFIGDKRGLGKTLSSLIWRRVQQSKKTLVCLRKQVANDFIKEISIREPGIFVYPLLDATAETREFAAILLNHHENFIVVTNIESWRRDPDKVTEDIFKIDYDAVILDEAHNIKNWKTGTAKGFFRIAEKVDKVLELSGTPIKNRPQEMFSLLHALYPVTFKNEKEFLRDYCVQIAQNRWAFSEYGLVELVKKIKHFYIARTPDDVGRNVPPPNVIKYELDFSGHPNQDRVYQILTEYSLAELTSGKILPVPSQLALMTRQAQMVSWPAGIRFVDPETNELIEVDIHESVKMDWAEDLIEQLVEEKLRIVFFSRFKPAIFELKKRLELKGIRPAVIIGGGSHNTKEIFDDFDLKTASKDNYKYDILLATYGTVGESVNLNAASHVIMYDRYWNPGNEDQAMGRIDRLNSVIQATVHVPEVQDSIDVYFDELIETKRNMIGQFTASQAEQQASLINHLKKTLKK